MQSILERFSTGKKPFIIFITCSSVILYFILYTIFGNRGIVDYFELRSQLQEKNLIKDKLYMTTEDKRNRVDRMKNESLDLDLLDEQVRQNLGHSKNNEIIIYQKKDN